MKTYLLDTDICIFLLKNKFDIEDKILSVGIENCFISELTIAELICGAYKSNHFTKHINEAIRLEELFETLPIRKYFNRFGEEKARLTTLGTTIADFDLLIGVTSVEQGMVMVTNNEKHYKRIKDIRIENWTKVSA